jgi:hypothetical protein
VFSFLMTSKTVKIVAALMATCLLAATAVAADKDKNKQSAPKSIILGKTKNYPAPACAAPRTCQVIARVTGIQMAADGTANPYLIPKDGQLVSWWLQLPKLTDAQIKSFDKLFGGEPAARIAVLRKGLKGRYRLINQSETVQLRDKLGSKGRVTIRLPQPIPVRKGDYVGLTSVTWMPSFAVGLGARGNFWLASRAKKRCATPSSSNLKAFQRYYKTNDAQLDKSTAKLYQCPYQTARLIYWARITPTDSSTTPTS